MNDDATTNIRGQRIRAGKGYETIRREALQDTRLSFKASGILGYLLSLPDNWSTNADRLGKAREGKEGRAAILSGLKELEDVGYLIRRRVHLGGGKWEWIWRYGDDPDVLLASVGSHQPKSGSPNDGRPVVTSPAGSPPFDRQHADLEVLDGEVLEERTEDNPQPQNLTPLITSNEVISTTRACACARETPGGDGAQLVLVEAPSRPKAEPTPDVEALFERFWGVYPRKVAKQKARQAWGKALKKVSAELIIEVAGRYAREQADPWRAQFTKHPATWLHGGCWDDEPQPGNAGRGGVDRRGGRQVYRDPEDPSGYYEAMNY